MTVLLVVLVIGVGTTLWSLVGVGRALNRTARHRRRPGGPPPGSIPTPADVAVLVAAHNEELVIERTVQIATTQVRPEQVYVISDGSRDATAQIAAAHGANVLSLNPNRGKAGALAAGIEHFELCDRYEVVMLLDADTHLAEDYLTTGLPLFEEPDVVAVAGRAVSIMDPPSPTRMGRFLVAYRERLYLIVQWLLKYGQAARWANSVPIVPGFASMYRTRALREIDVTGRGLVIEDFNMTFEVHRKKLGRIEFHPSAAIAHTQDPDRLADYRKQMRRWLLGFWQTVRRHGVLHRGTFWAALAFFLVELLLACVMWVVVLPVLLVSLVASAVVHTSAEPAHWVVWTSGLLTPANVALGLLLPDYLLSVMAAVVKRRPMYLVYGLFFWAMRILDAAICLRVIPTAWLGKSTGVWVSPVRRSVSDPSAAPAPAAAPAPVPVPSPVPEPVPVPVAAAATGLGAALRPVAWEHLPGIGRVPADVRSRLGVELYPIPGAWPAAVKDAWELPAEERARAAV